MRSGEGDVPASSLVLTVTRACDLRCSYCPTAKDGWPSLTGADAEAAVELFARAYGGGDLKLFGGEPLLVPDVVRAAIARASAEPRVRRIYLSTNGLGLDESWLRLVAREPKLILTISIDGEREDHARFRRGARDSWSAVEALRPRLLETPRVVVTQTIPPATAARAAVNFRALLSSGYRSFNLLPGYYLKWSAGELQALRASFAQVAKAIEAEWAAGRRLYLRNLFTRAPTPFFNSGVIVDADRSIHPSNVGLSGVLDHLREKTRAGTLDDPPSAQALAAKQAEVNGLLEATLPQNVWSSTLAVDAELTRFCEALYPAFAAQRRRREELVA